MDKLEFIQTYLGIPPQRITVQANWNMFLHDQSITVRDRVLSIQDVANMYAPWHHKEGVFEPHIEKVLEDAEYRSARLGQVLNHPHKLAEVMTRVGSIPPLLQSFPVATDRRTGRTLVLDGNNTLVFMLYHQPHGTQDIQVVEIVGDDLHRWSRDFQVVNRD